MRFVIGAILGLLVGAVCAVMAYNAISQRHAYSRGLMTVMGQALKQANDAAATTDCTNDGHALAKLSLLADDIETATEHPIAFFTSTAWTSRSRLRPRKPPLALIASRP